MRPVERGATPGIIAKDYSYWRPFLIARLGEYCSYCEVPLGVNLAVEHVLSKTQSINAEDWNNLLLACTNCNSHKRDKTLSEKDLENYFWPSDPYRQGFNTFSMLTYKKEPMTIKQLTDAGVFVRPSSRPQYFYPNPDTQTYDQVWVYPSATLASDANSIQKLKDTILLMGLNDFTPDDVDPTASDRRVTNRTAAWTRAKNMAALLGRYVNASPPDLFAIGLLKEQIKQAAIATGFWSVWMTVFKAQNFVDDATRNQCLAELFANTAMFPGTTYKVR